MPTRPTPPPKPKARLLLPGDAFKLTMLSICLAAFLGLIGYTHLRIADLGEKPAPISRTR